MKGWMTEESFSGRGRMSGLAGSVTISPSTCPMELPVYPGSTFNFFLQVTVLTTFQSCLLFPADHIT